MDRLRPVERSDLRSRVPDASSCFASPKLFRFKVPEVIFEGWGFNELRANNVHVCLFLLRIQMRAW